MSAGGAAAPGLGLPHEVPGRERLVMASELLYFLPPGRRWAPGDTWLCPHWCLVPRPGLTLGWELPLSSSHSIWPSLLDISIYEDFPSGTTPLCLGPFQPVGENCPGRERGPGRVIPSCRRGSDSLPSTPGEWKWVSGPHPETVRGWAGQLPRAPLGGGVASLKVSSKINKYIH